MSYQYFLAQTQAAEQIKPLLLIWVGEHPLDSSIEVSNSKLLLQRAIDELKNRVSSPQEYKLQVQRIQAMSLPELAQLVTQWGREDVEDETFPAIVAVIQGGSVLGTVLSNSTYW